VKQAVKLLYDRAVAAGWTSGLRIVYDHAVGDGGVEQAFRPAVS